MGFARMHVNRVEFRSVLLYSCLMKNGSLITCIFLVPNKGSNISSSQMSGWSRHLCLVTLWPIVRAYNKLSKSGLRFALAALVSEL
jgi:hypothetical protein